MSQNFAVWMRSGENCLLICENWVEEIRKKIVVQAIETNCNNGKKSQ